MMDKEGVIRTHTHWNTTAVKNNEIMLFAATWMDLEMIVLNKVCQKEKDKYRWYDLHVQSKI